MNRLTKDNDTQYDFVGSYDTNVEEFSNNKELRENVLNKLGQLEDIEEELDIDLITLFYALDNGIYYRVGNIVLFQRDIIITKDNYGDFILRAIPLDLYYTEYWKLKEYGKDWALTKEELENE